MPNAVLWTVIGLTLVLAPWWRQDQRSETPKRAWANAGFAVISAALAAWVVSTSPVGAWTPGLAGLLMGAAVAFAGFDLPDVQRPSSLALPIGMAVVLEWAVGRLPGSGPLLLLGFFAGVGAGAAFLVVQGCGRAAQDLALTGALVLTVNALGSGMPGAAAGGPGAVLAAAALLALLLDEIVRLAFRGKPSPWPRMGTVVLFGLFAGLAATKVLGDSDTGMIVGASVLAALVTAFFVRDDEAPSSWSVLVCALLWVGIATLAFSFLKGYGIAVSAVSGVIALLIMGNRRALMCAAPIVALAVYRYARSTYPDLSRGLDIAQHYALIGLLIGVFLPTAANEALDPLLAKGAVQRQLGALVIGLACLALLGGAVTLLGNKGASGLVVGLVLSPVLPSRSARPLYGGLAVATALSLATIVVIGVSLQGEEAERAQKVMVSGIAVGIVAVCAAMVWLLARPTREATQ